MGQYHYATIMSDDNKVLYALYGGKLCETPLSNNVSVNIISALSVNGAFHKHRLFWAGDYANPIKGHDHNVYYMAAEASHGVEFKELDIDCEGVFDNVGHILPCYRYAVNYDKREFCDLWKTPVTMFDDYMYQWNPLAVLCTSSNMTGGGDYDRKACYELVGTWTGDHIGIESEAPDGFKEILAQFDEGSEPLMTRNTVVNLLYEQFPGEKMNDAWEFANDYFGPKYRYPDPHWLDTKEQILEAFHKWRGRVSIQYHRKPTDAEIKRGAGAIHYIDVPFEECINAKGHPKEWIVKGGLRYYK